MALIELKSVTKTYIEEGGVSTEAIRGIDLIINEGEFLSIAGPSGSGKTTLLNLLGALDTPTSGTIIFDGQNISKATVSKLADFRLTKIGFVFQAYNLFNTLTAIENIEYVLVLQRRPLSESKRIAAELIDRVGLGDCAKKRANRLSGGQQQRVAVARALASHPKVILADEPTANLDSKTASSLLNLMHELNREKSVTFVFSTHDKMVMEKASRLVLIHDGKIVDGS